VLDPETDDRGLAMTSSFTNMLLTGQFLAHAANQAEYASLSTRSPPPRSPCCPRPQRWLPSWRMKAMPAFASSDRADSPGAAMESALKVLELTAGRVQSMSQATLALRHGPMAALDPNTLLVAFLSSQAARRNYESICSRDRSKGLVRTRVAIATIHTRSTVKPSTSWLPATAAAIPDAYRPHST